MEAKSIETRPIPYYLYRKHRHKRYQYAVLPITLVMLVTLCVVLYGQFSDKIWLTTEFRVQFRNEALHPYSGCYTVDRGILHHRRYNYNGLLNELEFDYSIFGSSRLDNKRHQGVFGYCLKERHWVLYKDDDSSDGKGVSIDPCEVEIENKLVYSADTDAHDIWSSFDELVSYFCGLSVNDLNSISTWQYCFFLQCHAVVHVYRITCRYLLY